MISWSGDTIRKDIDYKRQLKTEIWMESEWGDKVEEYHKLQTVGCIVTTNNGEGIDDDETSIFIEECFHLWVQLF